MLFLSVMFLSALACRPACALEQRLCGVVTRGGKETEPACEPDTARPMVGLGGFESWFFRAERPGTATLLMTCSRPWEKGGSPDKYYICAIKVR